MALSEETCGRLMNWKFSQAVVAMEEQETPAIESEEDLVRALAATFHNPGWFGGGLGTIVQAAVERIVPEEYWTEETEQESKPKA